jgi:RHS repeat-associated protein
MSGQTLQKYMLPLAAGLQAVYNLSSSGSTLAYFRHADWLGSSRFASKPSGSAQYSLAYAPFGETFAETGTADRSFTGQTQDVIAGSTGIYDFLLRQHISAQGRWLVPDPAGLAAVDLSNPQTWNRYAYVGNNPLSNVDPLGLRDCLDLNGNVIPNCQDNPKNNNDLPPSSSKLARLC